MTQVLNLDRRFAARVATAFVLFSAGGFLGGCQSTDPNAEFYPHVAVMSPINELEIHLSSDPYRYPPGTDLYGHNIFRVTLERLDNLDEAVGEQYDDILDFARGNCDERLGMWDEAAERWRSVAGAGTTLSSEANERLGRARRIAEAIAEPADAGSLDSYLTHSDGARALLEQMRREQPPYPYDSLLLVEIERLLVRKAHLLFENRLVSTEGAQRGLEVAEKLVEEHQASRLHGEHLLRLGEFSERLARDEALIADPAGARFDLDRWNQWIDVARSVYTRVGQMDGDPAKPEGQARLRGLDAYALRILERAR